MKKPDAKQATMFQDWADSERVPVAAPPPAPHSRPQTSREAAQSLCNAAALRSQVLAFIVSRGDEGATDEEIALALSLSGNTARPRRWELAKLQHIRTNAQRRTTLAGRESQVWVTATQL